MKEGGITPKKRNIYIVALQNKCGGGSSGAIKPACRAVDKKGRGRACLQSSSQRTCQTLRRACSRNCKESLGVRLPGKQKNSSKRGH